MDSHWDKTKLYIAIRQLEKARILLDDGSKESQSIIAIIDNRINRYKNIISKLTPINQTFNNHTRA